MTILLLASLTCLSLAGVEVADIFFDIKPQTKTPECTENENGEWNCYEVWKPRFCSDKFQCSWSTPVLETVRSVQRADVYDF